MASTKLLVGFLGIALAFAPTLLYDAYDTPGRRWGLTALDDQHVAGLIMALEQSIVMGIALAWLFVRMLERVRGGGAAGGALRLATLEHRAVVDLARPATTATSPRTTTSRRSARRPRTASRSASRSDGGPAGKRASKSRSELEVVVVELDERRRRAALRAARRARRRSSS